MKNNKDKTAKKSINLFIIFTSSILVAAVVWFFILPIVFNSGSNLLLSFFSKKEEIKLTAFSTEAFAYGMDDSSEVDGTTRVKGFQQDQKNNLYSSTLSYSVDLVTPKGDTVKSVFNRIVDKSNKEKMSDVQLDAQFDLGPSYAKGKYKLIYRIKDVLSGQSTVAAADFDLGD